MADLIMNLQRFAEEPEKETDPAENPEGNTTVTDGEKETKTSEDKTFTQEDVNRIAAKESKSATEKILKDLGVDDFDNAKDGLQKFQAWQESQKTESEKEREQYEATQKALDEKNAAYQSVVYENAALKAGVNTDSIDDVIALAEKRVTDDVDINAAMKAVVELYPQFSNVEVKEEVKPKPHFLSGNHNTASEQGATDPFAAKLEKWKNK